ncbi:M50 family metallopeptidase [Bacillus timonensis]|nr:M50 family metallopeptidase [Bacillus timonensis]
MNKLQMFSKIKIHPLLWFLIGISILTAHFRELLMLFLIVIVHEMGHVVSAHFFSWRIKKVELLPFGGVAEMDEHGNRPFREELIVTLSGPLQHIWLMGAAYLLHSFSIIAESTLHLFILQNIMILGINLLPIWPLDGGKLLFLILSVKQSFYKAYNRMLICSSVFLLIMVVAILVSMPLQLNLWIIISFLLYSLMMEWKQRHYVVMRFLLERFYGKNNNIANLSTLVVHETERIYHILLKFHRGVKHPIVIERKDGKKLSPIDENELLYAYFKEKKTSETVGDLYL